MIEWSPAPKKRKIKKINSLANVHSGLSVLPGPSPSVIGSFLFPVFSSRNTNTNDNNIDNGDCFLSDVG